MKLRTGSFPWHLTVFSLLLYALSAGTVAHFLMPPVGQPVSLTVWLLLVIGGYLL